MSFRDFLTNRWYRRRLAASMERFENIRPPRNPSGRYIGKLVKRLLNARTAREAQQELSMIGAAAVPSLVAALHDPRYLNAMSGDAHAPAPLEAVLGLLVPHGAEHVVAAAMPLAQSESDEVRKTVGLELASLGRAETLPVLAKLLQDEDGYVRSYVCIGVQRAIEAGRVDEAFKRGTYDLLLAQSDQAWNGKVNSAACAVVAVDRERAAVDFSSPRWLSQENRQVHQVLEACNRARIRVTEALLRRLLEHEMPRAIGLHCYPSQYIVAAALEALAISVGEPARPMLEGALNHEHEQVRTAAASGIVALAGIGDPVTYVFDREGAAGFGSLTRPQRVVFLAQVFDGEVCNGGLAQFFGNSSGDRAVETLDVLQDLDIPEAERTLAEAIRLVGPLARERDREARLLAFEGRVEQLMEAFSPLESIYYKDGRLSQAILLYAARHAEHFRP